MTGKSNPTLPPVFVTDENPEGKFLLPNIMTAFIYLYYTYFMKLFV